MKKASTVRRRRRMVRIFWLLSGMLGGPMAVWSAPAPASEILFGVHPYKSGFLGAEITRLLTAFIQEMQKQTGLTWRLEAQADPKIFLTNLKNKRYGFFWAYQHTNFHPRALAPYQPVTMPTLFGEKLHRCCLYVGKNNPTAEIGQLRGAAAMSYDHYLAYLDLRDMLGVAPEQFFRVLKPVQSGQNSLYALSLGQTDAAFMFSYNVDLFKKINPGPLKKIRQLACSPHVFPVSPIFALHTLPADIRQRFARLTLGMDRNPAFASFHPIMKRFGLTWFRPLPQHLRSTNTLEKKAVAGKWAGAHEHWLHTMQWPNMPAPRKE